MRRLPLLLIALFLVLPVACDGKKDDKKGDPPTTPPNLGGSKEGPPTKK